MPTTECVALCRITPSTASISSPRRSERRATSPFRRAGSAPWTHAPGSVTLPTRSRAGAPPH
eukprot:3281195-Alexandrium_andersonii.AAC.1